MVSSPENVTGMLDFVTKLNTVDVFRYMGPSLLMMVFMVMFVGLCFSWDTRRALAGAGALTTLFGIFLSVVGLVDWYWVFLFLVGTLIVGFVLRTQQ